MRVFILAYLVAAATALAPLHVAKERIPGKYIVTLKVSESLCATTPYRQVLLNLNSLVLSYE